eukprot:GCRY01003909.1.p1 GENE.GCRY01003909.1~~GCRY01003909.1.p1  ORF type:complete len:377 (+),score=89.11 GCRY01003909.1:237-1367(+)
MDDIIGYNLMRESDLDSQEYFSEEFLESSSDNENDIDEINADYFNEFLEFESQDLRQLRVFLANQKHVRQKIESELQKVKNKLQTQFANQKQKFSSEFKKRKEKLFRQLKTSKVIKTIDIMSFTLSVCFIFLFEFMMIQFPQHVFHVYALAIVPLMIFRYRIYHNLDYHYFMLDHCYFANGLLLFYGLFYPGGSALLFELNFLYCNGPLLLSVVTWQNSLIFHDVDKMTSLMLHALPPLVCFTLRWLDADHIRIVSSHNGDIVSTLHTKETFIFALMLYCLWQYSYYMKTEHIDRQKFAKKPNLETSLRWLTKESTSLIARVSHALHLKPVYGFMLIQLLYTTVCVLTAAWMYTHFLVHLLCILAVFFFSITNGAR